MKDNWRHKNGKPNVVTVQKVDNKDTAYLRYGIRRQDFVFHSRGASRLAYDSKVPHCVSSGHRLPCSRFTADDYGLVPVVSDCRLTGYMKSYEYDTLMYTRSVLLLFTWPSACMPPLPPQIYEGPCLPCSGRSRRVWLHRRRYGAVYTGLQLPVWYLKMRKWPSQLGGKRLTATAGCADAGFESYRSTCRWSWTPQNALWGCAARRARAGSWGRWGHSLPPGCQGCEEAAAWDGTGRQGRGSPAGQWMASASFCVTATESLPVFILTEPLSRRSSRALSPGRNSRVISADLHTCWGSAIHTLLYWRRQTHQSASEGMTFSENPGQQLLIWFLQGNSRNRNKQKQTVEEEQICERQLWNPSSWRFHWHLTASICHCKTTTKLCRNSILFYLTIFPPPDVPLVLPRYTVPKQPCLSIIMDRPPVAPNDCLSSGGVSLHIPGYQRNFFSRGPHS